MPLHLRQPLEPMEALSVEEIPTGDQWQYEPKWDGFRCIAFRDGATVELQSKSGQPLTRYFPEVVETIKGVKAKQFVLDGEIAIPEGDSFSFDALLQRIHPAESRVKRLAKETPAIYIVFDLLAGDNGKSLLGETLRVRRKKLEKFAAAQFASDARIRLSRATTDPKEARKWLNMESATLDGVIAKRLDVAYSSGSREGMQKIKNYRTADCVIGGFRYATGKKVVGSLLLGLYDSEGLLNHVGFTSSIATADKKALTAKLEPAIEPPGFTGRAPGGPSRWNRGKATEWQPLKPQFVVEVCYDHVSGERFWHGTKIVRWRPDKAPKQCTMDQLDQKRANLQRLLH
jgi:ATP-dependent DNA ligase